MVERPELKTEVSHSAPESNTQQGPVLPRRPLIVFPK
jgi:hypothetical protein